MDTAEMVAPLGRLFCFMRQVTVHTRDQIPDKTYLLMAGLFGYELVPSPSTCGRHLWEVDLMLRDYLNLL